MNKPTEPCNLWGEENYAGLSKGLDNDGDGQYDWEDADCRWWENLDQDSEG